MKNLEELKVRQQYRTKMAVDNCDAWFESIEASLLRTLQEVQRQRVGAYESDELSGKADRVTWAVNSLQQVNFRMDTATSVASDLNVAYELERLLEES